MAFADALQAWLVVLIVIVAVCFSEAVTWALVYRRPEYKRACNRVRDLTKKFEKEENKLVSREKRKTHERSIARLEEEVKEATNKMNNMKMKSNLMSSFGFFMLYRFVASQFTGEVVAQLPFEPFKLLRAITLRGIDSDDVRVCGFGFIYTLATMAFKANVPKLLGFAPPRSAFDPSKAAARAAAKAEAETS